MISIENFTRTVRYKYFTNFSFIPFIYSDHFIHKCRTLTDPVKLIQCLISIKEHAFVVSDYPVIITLEDHLTPDLQAKVAQVSLLFSL